MGVGQIVDQNSNKKDGCKILICWIVDKECGANIEKKMGVWQIVDQNSDKKMGVNYRLCWIVD